MATNSGLRPYIIFGMMCLILVISCQNTEEKNNLIPQKAHIIPRWEKGDTWVVFYTEQIDEIGRHSDEVPCVYKVVKADPEKEKKAVIKIYVISKTSSIKLVYIVHFHYTNTELWFRAIREDDDSRYWLDVNENKEDHVYDVPTKAGYIYTIIASFPSFPLYIPRDISSQTVTGVEVKIGDYVVQEWSKGSKWWSKASVNGPFADFGSRKEGRLAGEIATKKLLRHLDEEIIEVDERKPKVEENKD